MKNDPTTVRESSHGWGVLMEPCSRPGPCAEHPAAHVLDTGRVAAYASRPTVAVGFPPPEIRPTAGRTAPSEGWNFREGPEHLLALGRAGAATHRAERCGP